MHTQDTEPPNLRRYGADEAEALRTGYHPSPDPPSVIRRSRAWDAREALPAEMRRAACGRSGKGGCFKFKTADRQLAGDTAPPDLHAFNQYPAGRGLISVDGAIQDGSDAVITPDTARPSHPVLRRESGDHGR
ncbi:hypothetical protein ACPCUV_37435 [Streptomyces platensis]|uniref:hypothetical protein n=1 Tax=Streptomyces platensis TaxID=58346 RepID=UPI003C2F79E1